MPANAVVRARIDEHIKEEATVVLAAMGLTVSDAFRIMLTRIAREKALPFEPLVPNTETIEAHYNLAKLYINVLGAPEKGLPHLETVIRLAPDHPLVEQYRSIVRQIRQGS